MDGGLATFVLEPAFVLSVLVGAFNTCVYIFVRGRLGWHLGGLFVGGIIGALVGQAIGARVGDLVRVGDYSLLWASAVAWIGIGMAIVIASLVSDPGDETEPAGRVRPRE